MQERFSQLRQVIPTPYAFSRTIKRASRQSSPIIPRSKAYSFLVYSFVKKVRSLRLINARYAFFSYEARAHSYSALFSAKNLLRKKKVRGIFLKSCCCVESSFLSSTIACRSQHGYESIPTSTDMFFAPGAPLIFERKSSFSPKAPLSSGRKIGALLAGCLACIIIFRSPANSPILFKPERI